MSERREFPLKAVVYGCLVDELLEAYKNGERKFCDRSLPDGLVEGEPLRHRIITIQTIPCDGEEVRHLGFAMAEHYLLPILGSKRSESTVQDMYDYAHFMYESYKAKAEAQSEVVERLEIYWEIDEQGILVLAGEVFDDYAMLRTRPT